MSHAPIFSFNDARASIVAEVVRRVTAQSRDPLFLLNDAAYHETRRLSAAGGGAELEQWRTLAQTLGRLSPRQQRQRLSEAVERYAWDIAGNFDRRVYKVATKAVAPLLGSVLSPRATLKNLPGSLALSAMDSRIAVEGPREHVRKLTELGTVVYLPTHLSNLDSVAFGFALERSGLPPATYGAGKNLFSNPVLSFFMHNLGAYRVDRRLKHVLYKEVLKAYSCVLIERGYHSLFFPGGTRSRSGAVEPQLKLGLAGTGLEAYVRSAERAQGASRAAGPLAPASAGSEPERAQGASRAVGPLAPATAGSGPERAQGASRAAGPARERVRPVFFVPATINYLLTLEAETLIDDFLQERGKARYIIEDDESSRFGRVLAFANKFLSLDGACVVRLSRPLDCFGNFVDEQGRSLDPRGRPFDPLPLVQDPRGVVRRDDARDAEYTRELGEAILDAYRRDTVVMSTHLVSAVAFRRLAEVVGEGDPEAAQDVFALLRLASDVQLSHSQLAEGVAALRDELAACEDRGELRLWAGLRERSGRAIVSEALRAFAGYHAVPVLEPRGEQLAIVSPRLLLYYQNRLVALGHGWSAPHSA